MEQKRLNEFINNFLINANEMAYIEEALNTHRFLENFSELFRYIVSKEQSSTLFNELKVLNNYIYVQRIPYGDRFSITFHNHDKNKAIFINHLDVIDFLDSILYQVLEKYENYINITIEFEVKSSVIMTIKIDANNEKKVFIKNL